MGGYDDLVARVQTLHNLSEASGVLQWDQEVVMPDGGTPARAKQLSTLSAVHHEKLTAERTGRLLDDIDADALDAGQRAVVREVRREYERAVRVPTELVEDITETRSEAIDEWEDAKKADDFDRFAPYLERLLALKREYAEHIDADRRPYAVLFEDYEPYLSLETAGGILEQLRERLSPFIADITADGAEITQDAFHGSFEEDQLEAVSRTVLDLVGFDWTHGRLDVSVHPFTRGNQFDTRITTRYDTTNLLEGVSSLIHEFGHALYDMQLPQDAYGTPLGRAREMTIHESQSRFWENHIGRSKPFWETVLPRLADHVPQLGTVSPQDAFESANQVYPDNLIRTQADELTYHMHIVLRFELEQALFSGDVSVDEVPHVWREKMNTLLGVTPDNDRDGCLQDIHWSHGSFGYFPTYSLGSVLAAQLNEAVRDDIDVDQRVRDGQLTPLHDWLRDHIHRHGQRYRTQELIERVTGSSLSAEPFLDYATEKYGRIYGV